MPTVFNPAALFAALRTWNAFDWLLVAIVLLSTLAAFHRGFIKVLFSIGGLVCGILFASWNYLRLAWSLQRVIPSFALSEILAFLLLVIAVTIVFSVIAGLIQRAVSAVGLGFVDRLLGALVGVVRGLLFSVALMMASIAFFPTSPWLLESRLAPYFLDEAHAVSFVVPEHFQRQISSGANHLIQQSPKLFQTHPMKQPL